MKKFTFAVAFLLVGVTAFAQGGGAPVAPQVYAQQYQQYPQYAQPSIVAVQAIGPMSHSQTLRATFQMVRVSLSNGQFFQGARIVNGPFWGSPLMNLQLRPGDIVTRLDDIMITNVPQMDQHYADTKVRYVRQGYTYGLEGWVYLQNPNYQAPPPYTPYQSYPPVGTPYGLAPAPAPN